jgi:hypothetical protein
VLQMHIPPHLKRGYFALFTNTQNQHNYSDNLFLLQIFTLFGRPNIPIYPAEMLKIH